MIRATRYLLIAGLAVFWTCSTAEMAFANAAAENPEQSDKEKSASEADTAMLPFMVTRPEARNAFPPEILEKMHKKLMVLMGVDEKTPDAGKKDAHNTASH